MHILLWHILSKGDIKRVNKLAVFLVVFIWHLIYSYKEDKMQGGQLWQSLLRLKVDIN